MPARYVYAVAAILTLAAGYACWCRAPMIWDGAYQFNATLIMHRPYFYLTRFHTFFLWWPTVWASRFTSNITLLQTVYGLPFLLAPVAGVLLAWWMVRKDAPYLIVWVIFGVAAGSLPGQIFVINDSIFQQHLFWPIFVAIFVPLTVSKRIVIIVLALFQFVHPLGVVLSLGATLAALLVAFVDTAHRRRLLIRAALMGGLFILTTAKIVITSKIPSLYDGYAADEAKWSTAVDRWSVGVRGWPLHGLWFMWSAAAMLLIWSRFRGQISNRAIIWLSVALAAALAIMGWEYRHDLPDAGFGAAACILFFIFLRQFRTSRGPSPVFAMLPMLCIATALACWIHWAGDGKLWWKAIDYRRWVGPLSAPFFLLATFDVWAEAASRRSPRPARFSGHGFTVKPLVGESPRPASIALPEAGFDQPIYPRRSLRGPMALMLAGTFAIVLGLQSTVWHDQSARMMDEVRQYPASIVPESALPWMAGTPLDHWAVSDFVMAMGGKRPMKLLLDPRAEEHIYESPPKIPHWDFYPGARKNHPDPTPGPVGWFDLRPLLKQLKAEPKPTGLLGPERLDTNSTPE